MREKQKKAEIEAKRKDRERKLKKQRAMAKAGTYPRGYKCDKVIRAERRDDGVIVYLVRWDVRFYYQTAEELAESVGPEVLRKLRVVAKLE